ncbi:DUF6923 family protein [Haloglycomyces albus]|uniref:DUF6923 family protein n=1 Tax=Haloglycomyces albus TaxID=526067 RepID=UPI00046D36E6|nr:hypothetical protein [Haloglycomyces albus]
MSNSVRRFVIAVCAGAVACSPHVAVAQDSEPCDDQFIYTWSDPETREWGMFGIEPERDTSVRPLASLPERINAVGWHDSRQSLFGLARPPEDSTDYLPRLVEIDRDGEWTDHGPLEWHGAPLPGLAGAFAGDVVDDHLMVVTRRAVVGIDLESELGVVTEKLALDEVVATGGVGDVGYWDDALWGVSTERQAFVRIDLVDGTVEYRSVPDVPSDSTAGAVSVSDDRIRFLVNNLDDQAVLFEADLDGEDMERLAEVEVVTSSDSAHCPAREQDEPADPSESPTLPADPIPPESPTPVEPTPPKPTSEPVPDDAPAAVPPPTVIPPPEPQPSNPPPPPSDDPAVDEPTSPSPSIEVIPDRPARLIVSSGEEEAATESSESTSLRTRMMFVGFVTMGVLGAGVARIGRAR